MIATCLITLASFSVYLPHDEAICDHCDLIEINHFYGVTGWPVFDQLIYYEFDPEKSRYQVIAWRMVKSPVQIPQREWNGTGYVATWHDQQSDNLLRRVRTISVTESWTKYDPEVIEREYLSLDKRKGLKNGPAK